MNLASHFNGPFQILEGIDKVANKLVLPAISRLHHVVGVIAILPKFNDKITPIQQQQALIPNF